MTDILIVEDETSAARLLKDLLTEVGYSVRRSSTAEDALQQLKSCMPDLMILDLGLPGMSGVSLCEVIRKNPNTSSLPIIMLTSQKAERRKVEGLETGADDYVTKPFAPKELLARIEALLRRVQRGGQLSQKISVGTLSLDAESREVHVDGKLVSLTPKEYELLSILVQGKGRVLSYSMISDVLWGQEKVGTRYDIKWYVHHLREKIGVMGDWIHTVTGQGYKFADPAR